MTYRHYFILDVFTDRALAGNPLAVVTDCDGLGTERMQAIAREFNLSETVFVLPPEKQGNRANLRIFMPHRELPFAGHPTVGSAVLLALRDGLQGEGRFVVEEGVGDIHCVVQPHGERWGHATFQLPRLPVEVGTPAAADQLAAALGIAPEEIGFPGHFPSRYSAGNAFSFVPVRDLRAADRVRANPLVWNEVFGPTEHAVFVYTRETRDAGAGFHARMLEPAIVEDPATGSAAAAFAGVVMRFDQPQNGAHMVIIEQGIEMGRPSRIELGLRVEHGKLASATVGGSAVIVAEGQLFA